MLLDEEADDAEHAGHPQQDGEGAQQVLEQQTPPRLGRDAGQGVGTVLLQTAARLALVQADVQVGGVPVAQLRQRDAVVVIRLLVLEVLEGVVVVMRGDVAVCHG